MFFTKKTISWKILNLIIEIYFLCCISIVTFGQTKCLKVLEKTDESQSTVIVSLSSSKILDFHKMIDERSSTKALKKMIDEDRSIVNSFHPVDGYTPLIRAARSGNSETVELLIYNGADINLPEQKSMNALAAHKAAFMGHFDVIRLLLYLPENGLVKKMLETQGPKNGKTVLMDALWVIRPNNLPQVNTSEIRSRILLAQTIIERSKDLGVNIDIKDYEGKSAFDHAQANVVQFPEFVDVATKLTKKKYINLDSLNNGRYAKKMSFVSRKADPVLPLGEIFNQIGPNDKAKLYKTIEKLYSLEDYLHAQWHGEYYKTHTLKEIERVLPLIRPEHRGIFFDLGIATRAKSFLEWYNENLNLQNQGTWEIREAFSNYLGTKTFYRAIFLDGKSLESIKSKGVFSQFFWNVHFSDPFWLAFEKVFVRTGITEELLSRLSNKTALSTTLSISTEKEFALATAGGFGSARNGKKLYLLTIRVPELDTIHQFNLEVRATVSERNLDPKGEFYIDGELTPLLFFQGPSKIKYSEKLSSEAIEDLESFVPLYIHPDNIIQIHEFSGNSGYRDLGGALPGIDYIPR